MFNYDDILKDFDLKDEDVIQCVPYGSRVYGTYNYNSDYDFMIIMKNGTQDRDSLKSSYHNYNVSIVSEDSFRNKLKSHQILALEVWSLPNYLKVSKYFKFKVDKGVLRESISEKASHSWVKAKKKFEVEKDRDIYVAKKSLFHSMRIIDFGIQIANNGKVVDFTSCNGIWGEINKNNSECWEDYKKEYQEYFNNQMTKFRLLAPKGK